MARQPTQAEIDYALSDDPAKHDVSNFSHTHYFYNFPYETRRIQRKEYSIHDMVINQVSVPFLTVHSSRILTKAESYLKLSVCLALLSIFEKEGFAARPISAIGGYNNGAVDEVYHETIHSAEVQGYIDDLYKANNPYQIQSRFTLSRAHSLMFDPESAIIEFFKVIELFIKNCAYTMQLPTASAQLVLAERKIFDSSVERGLIDNHILDSQTVDVIWKLKNIRNRFVGHGGVRPTVADIFSDPENNRDTINYLEFQYDSCSNFGEPFYEKVMYDMEVISMILFCKMNDIAPVYMSIPGCWWQPSEVIQNIIDGEGVLSLNFFPSALSVRDRK